MRIEEYPGLIHKNRGGLENHGNAVYLAKSKTDKYGSGTWRCNVDNSTVEEKRALTKIRGYLGSRITTNPRGYIFTVTGDVKGDSPVSVTTLRHLLQEVCNNLGINWKEVGWIATRKTFTNIQKEQGMSLAERRTCLGHGKDSRVTEGHYTMARKRPRTRKTHPLRSQGRRAD